MLWMEIDHRIMASTSRDWTMIFMGAASHIQLASRIAQLRLLTAEQSTDQWLWSEIQSSMRDAGRFKLLVKRRGGVWLTDW